MGLGLGTFDSMEQGLGTLDAQKTEP